MGNAHPTFLFMFQSVRYRLLWSYLLIFASILSIFAVSVRLLFAYNFRQQMLDKLTTLGMGIVANLESENDQLKMESDFKIQDLINQNQSIQWFNLQGKELGKEGKFVMSFPFSKDNSTQIQPGNPQILGIILPIIDNDHQKLMGYIRISQSLEEEEEILAKLDRGLGIGILGALMLSAFGGIVLTNQAMQPIEDSFQRLKQFTADASHELRNPLMAIESNVSVSLKYPEGMRDTDRESFEAIASATDQMINLTEDFLLLARAQKIKMLKKEPINLSLILQDLFSLFEVKAQKKHIDLSIKLEEKLFLLGDNLLLQRLFSNLVENAIYYTSEKGFIKIQGKVKDSFIEVEVKDSGMGIASENLPKIFERFWRSDPSRSYHQKGSGLGLAIVKAIVTQHKGKITVKSQLGVGSCFLVILPMYQVINK